MRIQNLESPFENKYRYIYVCSPYSGDLLERIRNKSDAIRYCAEIFREGCIPVAPQLYFPQFGDRDNLQDRTLMTNAGLSALCSCSEMRVYGEKISRDMQTEIDRAFELGIPVRHYKGVDKTGESQDENIRRDN